MKTQKKEQLANISIPAEWENHKAMWTAFPSAADLWLDDLEPAREEFVQMVRALAEGETVNVLACGDEAVSAAKDMLGDCANIIPADFGDIWLRDTGPIFTASGAALRFQTNGWGGKYDLEHDDTVGDVVANEAGADIIRHEFVLEGGALEHDGAGIILTTRQCLLNPNRNPGWTQEKAEEILKKTFGAKKILWLNEGLVNDHTDGHIDNIARFIAPGKVVCQSPYGKDDPNTDILNNIAQELKDMGLQVVQIPSPGRVENEDGKVVPASHMNFIIGNKVVVVPTYGTDSAEDAVKALKSLFPGRKVIGAPSSALLTGGGSFHCITQQEPA